MTAKPGLSPSTSAVARKLAAAGFDVAQNVDGSYNHERAREGARIRPYGSPYRNPGNTPAVSVSWNVAFTEERFDMDEYRQHNAPLYVAAYAAYLADFYDVTCSEDGKSVYLSQKPEIPRVAKGAPRVKAVAATLDTGGIPVRINPRIYDHGGTAVVWQRLDCVEVATDVYRHDGVRLTHEQATERTRGALMADGWIVEQYDRVDSIILRVTGRAAPAESERTESVSTLDFPVVTPRPAAAEKLLSAAWDAGWNSKDMQVTDPDGMVNLSLHLFEESQHRIIGLFWRGTPDPTTGEHLILQPRLSITNAPGVIDAEKSGAIARVLEFIVTHPGPTMPSDSPLAVVADKNPQSSADVRPPAPVEGSITARAGEGTTLEYADHPVVRAVIADLIDAGHAPLHVVNDDPEAGGTGFYVAPQGEGVRVWHYTEGERGYSERAYKGPKLKAYGEELRRRGWPATQGSFVVDVTGSRRENECGYYAADAAQNPQVAAAATVLITAEYKPATSPMPGAGKTTGFWVDSDRDGAVIVNRYQKNGGIVQDTDDGFEILEHYAYELEAAGWTVTIGSGGLYARPPGVHADPEQLPAPPVVRYAYVVQTRTDSEEWQDTSTSGLVLSSDPDPERFGRAVLKGPLPPITAARRVRVSVWTLDSSAGAVTVDAVPNPNLL